MKRYKNIDGLRAYACIGIVMMHVLTNGYNKVLTGFVFDKLILSFTNFTYLFMVLSAFSMCCGYFKRFQENSISVEQFYKRRYQRIWPYFALLCTIELGINHSLNALYEWFADLTLVFGLMPNNRISVIGVGWFLGTVFVFYMLFPFFVFCIKNKRRAWFSMVICLILHILCLVRFTEVGGRANIVYSSIYFVAGGIVFLYKEELSKYKIPFIVITILSVVLYFTIDSSDFTMLVLFSSVTITSIVCGGVFQQQYFRTKQYCLSAV